VTTILIVDDEQPVRSILAELLQDAGYLTHEAANGAQALALVAGRRPDLIISDIMMPLLSGVELVRQLKARDDTRAIPIILLSAAGRWVGDLSSADGYLPKPFDIVELEALIERLLNPPSSPDASAPEEGTL
jgi:two-component system phosphate regulon response regulator PhoB